MRIRCTPRSFSLGTMRGLGEIRNGNCIYVVVGTTRVSYVLVPKRDTVAGCTLSNRTVSRSCEFCKFGSASPCAPFIASCIQTSAPQQLSPFLPPGLIGMCQSSNLIELLQVDVTEFHQGCWSAFWLMRQSSSRNTSRIYARNPNRCAKFSFKPKTQKLTISKNSEKLLMPFVCNV